MMFDDASDTPLFSQTAPRATIKPFTPKPTQQTMKMFACPICFDTGYVTVKKGKVVKCTCVNNTH